MNYTLVAKIETLNEDLKFLGILAGVIFPDIKSHESSGGRTQHLAIKYFQKLTKKTVWRLYKRYQLDFEMFNYSPQAYLDIAQI